MHFGKVTYLIHAYILADTHLFIYLFIYLLHLFTQGKPKQLTLVFIGALHSFHIVTNMHAQYIIQYSQIARTCRILKHYIYNIIKAGLQGNVNTRFLRSSRLNEVKQVIVRNCGCKSFHMIAPLTAKLVA